MGRPTYVCPDRLARTESGGAISATLDDYVCSLYSSLPSVTTSANVLRSALSRLAAASVAAASLTAAAPADAPQSYDITAIDREVKAQCASGTFSGVVLIQAGSRRLYEHACGMADPVNRIVNTRGTRFKIFSTSKFLTALVVMRLSELGTLELDAPVSRYVRDVPRTWRPVTLRMLLNHTSGVQDLSDLAFGSFRSTPEAAMRDTLARVPKDRARLLAPAGTAFAYNNFGFELLADAAAHAAGRPFAELLDTLVFKPAGMATASVEPPNVLLGHPLAVTEPGVAIGFNGTPGKLEQATNYAFMQLGAGAVRATVDDFVALDRALSEGRVISRESYAAMKLDLVTEPSGPAPRQFGLGMIVTTVNGVTMEGHTGGTNGYISDFERLPGGVMMIALSNRGFTKTRWLREGVAEMVRQAR